MKAALQDWLVSGVQGLNVYCSQKHKQAQGSGTSTASSIGTTLQPGTAPSASNSRPPTGQWHSSTGQRHASQGQRQA